MTSNRVPIEICDIDYRKMPCEERNVNCVYKIIDPAGFIEELRKLAQSMDGEAERVDLDTDEKIVSYCKEMRRARSN